MQENFNLQNCSNDDALLVKDKAFKIGQVKEAVTKAFRGELAKILYDLLNSYGVQIDPGGHVSGNKFYRHNHKWFDDGINCEILKIGAKGWQKGKIKIKVTLEFCPDEPEIEEAPEITQPESPLDDIRRMINEVTT